MLNNMTHSLGNESLGDPMVRVPAKPRFLLLCPRQGLVAMPPLASLGPVGRLAQPSASRRILDPLGLDLRSPPPSVFDSRRSQRRFAFGVGGDEPSGAHDPQVDADELLGVDRGPIGDVDRHQQEPLAIIAKDQVGLPLGPAEPIGLVLPHDERDDRPSAERADADAIRSLEADVLAHRVGNGRVLAKLGLLLLVPLVRLADLRDASDGHVGGKAEPLAKLDVTELLEQELVGEFPLERHARQPCRASLNRSTVALSLAAASGSGRS